jgi:hypothetical protein
MFGAIPSSVDTGNSTQHIGQITGWGWGLHCNGYIYNNNNGQASQCTINVRVGDVIRMEIDMDKQSIKFTRNYVDLTPVISGIPKSVRVAVSLLHHNDTVEWHKVERDLPVEVKKVLPKLIEPLGFSTGTLWKECIDRCKACKHPVNILLFGEFGHGKSSTLCTLLTAFEDGKEINQAAVVRPDSGHVTSRLDVYNIPHTKINICDIWGWDVCMTYDISELS